jgi:phospholipid/cholesterol/gamma-HCH transport system substrate-binding protein
VYRSLSRWQAVVLAVVVLGGLALGTLGLFAVGSRHWLGDAFHVRAGFADVGGVEVGTRVHIQGLDAGEVEAVEIPAVSGGQVALRLRVAGKYRNLVGADAVVEIAGESVLGGKVVRIVPGRPGAPPAAEDALLPGRVPADLTASLAQTAERLGRTLNQVDAVLADVRQGKGSLGKLVRDETLYDNLTATVAEAQATLGEVRRGEGTLGKLVKDNDAYVEAVKSLQDVRQLVSSVKQNSDAIKSLPVVRSYVVDPPRELIRPDCKRYRKWYSTGDLFEPGRAVLTARGRGLLDQAGAWLGGLKPKGSEVAVAAFADPHQNAELAQIVTKKQSEAVAAYLKSRHKVHRVGFWWWANRPVRAIGCGVNPPPVPETEKLPPARVEVLVFVPQR